MTSVKLAMLCIIHLCQNTLKQIQSFFYETDLLSPIVQAIQNVSLKLTEYKCNGTETWNLSATENWSYSCFDTFTANPVTRQFHVYHVSETSLSGDELFLQISLKRTETLSIACSSLNE
jgi:hypothetical protein